VGGVWVLFGKIKSRMVETSYAAIWVGLCVGIAALLILRSVGIFCSFVVGRVGLLGLLVTCIYVP